MNKPVICLALAMAATAGVAAESPPGLDRLVDCASLKGSRERLACFDQEIAPLAKARATGSAPVAAVAPPSRQAPAPSTPAIAPAAPGAAFGREQLAPKLQPVVPDDEQTLHASITELRQTGSSFIVTLDNGQAWRHDNQALGEYLRKGEAVTISKGALGSYRLTRDAGAAKNWIRVTRIR